jgi:hypothetical protein
MSFNKILSHPDKNTIIRMLTRGQGVRSVAKFLKEKYKGEKQYHISAPTLQKFRKQKLNLEGEALEAIKHASREKTQLKEDKKEDTKLRRLPAYKEKIKEVIDYHVNIQNELKELMVLAKSRMEDLFDKAARGEITINEEANLQKYFLIITTTIERWAKYVEKIADKTVETTNVNITVIEDQMSIMREAVRETIEEMDPEMAIKFIDRLNNKITVLSYKHKKEPTFGEIKDDVKVLTAEVEEIEHDGD